MKISIYYSDTDIIVTIFDIRDLIRHVRICKSTSVNIARPK